MCPSASWLDCAGKRFLTRTGRRRRRRRQPSLRRLWPTVDKRCELDQELAARNGKDNSEGPSQWPIRNPQGGIAAERDSGNRAEQQRSQDVHIDRADHPVAKTGDKGQRYRMGDVRADDARHRQLRIQQGQNGHADGRRHRPTKVIPAPRALRRTGRSGLRCGTHPAVATVYSSEPAAKPERSRPGPWSARVSAFRAADRLLGSPLARAEPDLRCPIRSKGRSWPRNRRESGECRYSPPITSQR
jgi:hypothetical protein